MFSKVNNQKFSTVDVDIHTGSIYINYFSCIFTFMLNNFNSYWNLIFWRENILMIYRIWCVIYSLLYYNYLFISSFVSNFPSNLCIYSYLLLLSSFFFESKLSQYSLILYVRIWDNYLVFIDYFNVVYLPDDFEYIIHIIS